MNLSHLSREEIKSRLFQLMDDVMFQLQQDPNIDDFLDQTLIFDCWDAVLGEAEYPIFLVAVLNNIRREAIITVILDSILGTTIAREFSPTNNPTEDHPFC
jgi:hypothetical protein